MKRCYQCGSEKLVIKNLPDEIEVAGVKFTADLPSTMCENCGASTVSSEALGNFELAIARKLAQLGLREGEAFRFMRKAIGKRAMDLAQDLDSTPETISRWENGHAEIEPRAFLLLANLVEDKIRGENTTEKLIQALHEKPKKPQRIPLKIVTAVPA
jgi:DNA-binding transcriptional regulator YiaG